MYSTAMLRAANTILSLVVLALLTSSCGSSSALDSQLSGRTLVYSPGVPNFDLEAIATLRGDQSGIDLYIGLPKASLIFLKRGDEYVARYEVSIELRDEDDKYTLDDLTWSDTVRVADYEETQQYDQMIIQRRFNTEEGRYIVDATITDNNSEQIAERRLRLEVFSRETTGFALSRIRVEAREGAEPFKPIVSYHLPSSLDSLRSVVELYNVPPGEKVLVEMSLVSFPSDTSVANPPYWLTPNIGSLTYQGVDFSKPDTVQVTRRVLGDVQEDVTIEFTFPSLTHGTYRMTIEARSEDAPPEEAEILKRQRNLSIKSEDFPHVSTLNQLIDALSYIAYERELKEIRAGATVEERRARFDAFWGKLVNNREAARNLIKQYYGRVEEANLFFTGQKEGWKTDRGMVYIILGAPVFVEYSYDMQIWHYSYSDRDALNSFDFRRVRPFGNTADFENYILLRRPFYERAWTRAIERWRSGSML
ncbi:MAG: GWxTD domain-containing protein [Rhodothermales bacterium]